jgi:hypothetical protein
VLSLLCCHAGRAPPGLLEKLTQDMLQRSLRCFVPQAISNVVWSCAVLNYTDPALLLVRVTRHKDRQTTGR